MGNFNVDLLKSNGSSEFYTNLSSHFFTPFVLQPTRLKAKTLIDNIFLNSLEFQSNSGNVLLEISDHLLQFLILEGFLKERSLPETNIFKRDFSKFNEREFDEVVISSTNWDEICMLYKNDSNASFKSFYDTLNYHLDEMAPYKKVTRKEFRLMLKPWITNDILSKCNERDSLLKDMKNENDPVKIESLRKDYKLLRNKITQEKRDSKKSHYAAYFEKNRNKASDIWKGIRSLVNIKPTKATSIKLFDENKNLISDPRKIVNVFNDHFSTIGTKVQQKIPVEHGNFKDYLNKRDKNGKLYINPDGNSFFLGPTVPGEISKIIDSLDSSKSTGPNGIPAFLFKSFKDSFSI